MRTSRASRFVLFALLLPSLASASASLILWGSAGSGRGELRSPLAVAARGDRVYVADFDNDRVQVFTRDGAFLFAWGSTGADPGQFRGPAGLAVDREGSVFVADHYNHRIQKFSGDGLHLGGWNAGDAEATPLGLAVDGDGRVYATDLDAGRVRVWSRGGDRLAEWGDLAEPWGIAVDAGGDIWVADHGRDRVARFTRDGEALGALDAASGEDRLLGPMGVAAGADGSILASDLRGGRVVRFGPGGAVLGSVQTADHDLADAYPVTGLAAETSGDVWVADPMRHQIGRIAAAALGPTVRGPVPTSFGIASVRPTPSRGPVTLGFAVPARGALTVEVFSLQGRRVWSTPRADVEPGEHFVVWNGRTDLGRSASTGIYFVRVQFDDGARRITRGGRIVVIR